MPETISCVNSWVTGFTESFVSDPSHAYITHLVCQNMIIPEREKKWEKHSVLHKNCIVLPRCQRKNVKFLPVLSTATSQACLYIFFFLSDSPWQAAMIWSAPSSSLGKTCVLCTSLKMRSPCSPPSCWCLQVSLAQCVKRYKRVTHNPLFTTSTQAVLALRLRYGLVTERLEIQILQVVREWLQIWTLWCDLWNQTSVCEVVKRACVVP